MPKVSIITPLYNAEAYIDACIDSVQEQTFDDWEMMIIDDASQDQGYHIASQRAAHDPRIKVTRLKQNSGAAVARNIAIQAAAGRYLAFLDADDCWHPEKLQRQIDFMNENDYSFTYTWYQSMDVNGNLLGKIIQAPEKVNHQQMCFSNYIGSLTVIIDTQVLGKVSMPNIYKRQDYALWLKLLKRTPVAYGLQECLAFHRKVPNSLSSAKLKLIPYQWQMFRECEGHGVLQAAFYVCTNIWFRLKKYARQAIPSVKVGAKERRIF